MSLQMHSLCNITTLRKKRKQEWINQKPRSQRKHLKPLLHHLHLLKRRRKRRKRRKRRRKRKKKRHLLLQPRRKKRVDIVKMDSNKIYNNI